MTTALAIADRIGSGISFAAIIVVPLVVVLILGEAIARRWRRACSDRQFRRAFVDPAERRAARRRSFR